MSRQSPYDTGDRLEPVRWVKPRTGTAGRDRPRPAEPDDYGKVDFNNDEDATEAVVWFQRGADGYELHCYSMQDEVLPVVQHHVGTPVLQLQPEPLPEDRMLFMHERFATAEPDGAQVCFTMSPGRTSLSCEVTFLDGSRVTQTLDLQPALSRWAENIINERGA